MEHLLFFFTHAYTHKHTQHVDVAKISACVLILFLAQWGFTALLRAACEGHAELVRMLMDCGSTLNEMDDVSVHPAPMSTDCV